MPNPAKPFVVLLFVIFAVAVYAVVGPALLGPLGDLAKDSAGSNGEGWTVSNESIDRSADTALVEIPTMIMSTVGIWAVLALLIYLAYVGVI